MKVKQILDEIAAEPSTNAKMEILRKYTTNETLKRAMYLAKSKRINYYIKKLPEYTPLSHGNMTLDQAMDQLYDIINRKVTGHAAVSFLQTILSSLEPDDAYVIERIIDRNLKIDMGTSNINKVIDNLIEDTYYMGATSFKEKNAKNIFEKGGYGFSQIKMDGRYCYSVMVDGNLDLESRSGEPTIVTGAKFLEELAQFENCVLTGELTIPGIIRAKSNGIITSIIDIISKREERTEKENAKKLGAFEKEHGPFNELLDKIIFTVWDQLSPEEYYNAKSDVPYSQRLAKLDEMIKNANSTHVQMIYSRVVKSYSEAMEHFQEALAAGEEGTILKASEGLWRDGKHSNNVKMKLEMDIDLKITGFNYGTKGTKNEHVISSLNCESSDGLLKTRPQGLTEVLMKKITAEQDQLLGTIIQCKCNGLSQNSNGIYSLLGPAFDGFRPDKNVCDSLESIRQIENMAKKLPEAIM